MLTSSGTGAIFIICFNDQESGLLPVAVLHRISRSEKFKIIHPRFSNLGDCCCCVWRRRRGCGFRVDSGVSELLEQSVQRRVGNKGLDI